MIKNFSLFLFSILISFTLSARYSFRAVRREANEGSAHFNCSLINIDPDTASYTTISYLNSIEICKDETNLIQQSVSCYDPDGRFIYWTSGSGKYIYQIQVDSGKILDKIALPANIYPISMEYNSKTEQIILAYQEPNSLKQELISIKIKGGFTTKLTALSTMWAACSTFDTKNQIFFYGNTSGNLCKVDLSSLQTNCIALKNSLNPQHILEWNQKNHTIDLIYGLTAFSLNIQNGENWPLVNFPDGDGFPVLKAFYTDEKETILYTGDLQNIYVLDLLNHKFIKQMPFKAAPFVEGNIHLVEPHK